MTTPQPGIFALGTRYHHHLEFDLRPGATDAAVVEALAAFDQSHVTGGGTNLVVGFGPALWGRLAAGRPVPADLQPYEALESAAGHRLPATQHDLWVWVHGSGLDTVFDVAQAVAAAAAPIATVAVDCPSFVYHDSRDLTGFIDGTANPAPAEAPPVACVPDGLPGAGGSHVVAQRWIHDLAAFGALPVAEQERVFGRTKPDSVALPAEVRPADAHISRAEVLAADGEEREIYRRSTPFGTVSEQGLYFVAFSAEQDRFAAMLRQMYGLDGSGVTDRLLGFSTPVTGSYYFAPSLEELRDAGVPVG
jgi:putative iron-dependent peroxidase